MGLADKYMGRHAMRRAAIVCLLNVMFMFWLVVWLQKYKKLLNNQVFKTEKICSDSGK